MNTKTQKAECHCQQDVLVVTKQSASYLLSFGLLVVFFIFIAGYFWGHQQALQEFHETIEQQSFADQIHYSLSCCIDDAPDLYAYDDSAEQEVAVQAEQPETLMPTVAVMQEQQPDVVTQYCAHLVGFQSKEKANQCKQTLANKGLDVRVAQRSSSTKNGKKIAWYQVVTKPHATKTDLLAHIATIRQIVKLHDVQIVSISAKKETNA